MLRRELPEDKWMTDDKDVKYLSPFIQQVLNELGEAEKYEKDLFVRE